MTKSKYIINEELNGTRIDKAVPRLDNEISRVSVQRLIEEGKITVNGKNVKASYKVNTRR